MQGDIDRILISRERIAARVTELAGQITADQAAQGTVAPTTIIPILTGAMIFCADLIRGMPMAMQIGLLGVSSYPGKSLATQGSQLIAQQLGNVAGRHVLLVDDILDSGGTLRMVRALLTAQNPASLRACVLLRKDRPAALETPVDYVGFDIPDEFVVGYGLDFNNYYRNLPDIVTLKAAVISGKA